MYERVCVCIQVMFSRFFLVILFSLYPLNIPLYTKNTHCAWVCSGLCVCVGMGMFRDYDDGCLTILFIVKQSGPKVGIQWCPTYSLVTKLNTS